MEDLFDQESALSSVAKDRLRSFSLYHPNNNGNGSLLSLSSLKPVDDKSGGVFIKLVPQRENTKVGDKKLFNTNKESYVVVKLNCVEVGSFLSVLYGNQDKVGYGQNSGLIHKNHSGSKSIFFEKTQNGYRLNILENNNGEKKNIGFNVFNGGEAIVVMKWLENALSVINPVL